MFCYILTLPFVTDYLPHNVLLKVIISGYSFQPPFHHLFCIWCSNPIRFLSKIVIHGRVHIWQVEGKRTSRIRANSFWDNNNASNGLVFQTPGNNIQWLKSSLHMIWQRLFMCAILYNGKLFTEICELDGGAVQGEVGLICWSIDIERQCSFIVCSAHFNRHRETMLWN